jgi:hypothetical protein
LNKAVDVQASVDRQDSHLGHRYRTLYNRWIDFGAHPNEQGLFSRVQKTELSDGIRFDVLYLQGDGLGTRHALRTTAQTGICVLLIFKEVFPARFAHSGVDQALPSLSEGL